MLVNDKFIFIEIPRCASTSFVETCLHSGIKIKNIKSYGYETLIENGLRFHTDSNSLQEHFGYHYPIIAIKRDKVASFISFWKHTIKVINEFGFPEVSNAMSKMLWQDIFFFETDDYDFFNNGDLIKFTKTLIERIHPSASKIPLIFFSQLFLPKEWFHRNNPNIQWFDFNNLSELEKWVSKILNKDFKLLKTNESNDVECNLIIDDTFVNKYNELYSKYQNIKTQKSLL